MSSAPIPTSRVLIVDDDINNRRLLTAIVRRAGHVAVEAADGEEALGLARREPPDLVLLDISMPRKDGFQVCAELVADPVLGDVPVILISAFDAAAQKIKGLELGAADYITKPFDLGEVLARIRTHLRLRYLHRELLQRQRQREEDAKAAAEIQRTLVPRTRPALPGLEVAWRFQPSGRACGDLFDVYPLDGEHVALYVLDVPGHGVQALQVAASVARTLSPEAGVVLDPDGTGHPVRSPAGVLDALDREYPFERFERPFTLSYLVLNTRGGLLRHASAGHPLPLLLRAGGGLEMLAGGGPPVGLELGQGPPGEGHTTLRPGDQLFLYTDGLVTPAGAGGAPFGVDRLCATLREGAGAPPESLCERVLQALRGHAGDAQVGDDLTLLAVGYRGAGGVA